MKKKIIPVCLVAVMTVSCLFTVPAVESQAAETHPARLVDDGDLLSEQEEKRLESRLDQISEDYYCDVAVGQKRASTGQNPWTMRMIILIIKAMEWERTKAESCFWSPCQNVNSG